MVGSPYLVKPGKKFAIDKVDPDETGKFRGKSDAKEATEKNLEELCKLQEIFYAESKHALLIVFQAMDAGGKDGAIEHVFGGVNPQGCSVTSFKVPTPKELSHDFLWRYHLACPAKGMFGIFNRSHYEAVLVERVKDLVPKDVWSRRYDHINEFERRLSDEGTTILKFYLHISKDEQKKRLEARLKDPEKLWKFNPADLKERKHWDSYMEAFEDALSKCSQTYAPWYCVPANKKWFRNWVISDTILRVLRELDPKYPKPDFDPRTIRIDDDT